MARRRGTQIGTELEDLVQAAGAVSLHVETHVLIADGLQFLRRCARLISGSSARASRRGRFRAARWCRDAGRGRRGSRDGCSASSACSIIDSLAASLRSEYGMRDDRHADAGSSQVGRPMRRDKLADLVLRQIGFIERAADAELARGLASRAIVAAIVGVAAVGDDRRCRVRWRPATGARTARSCSGSSDSPDWRGIRVVRAPRSSRTRARG